MAIKEKDIFSFMLRKIKATRGLMLFRAWRCISFSSLPSVARDGRASRRSEWSEVAGEEWESKNRQLNAISIGKYLQFFYQLDQFRVISVFFLRFAMEFHRILRLFSRFSVADEFFFSTISENRGVGYEMWVAHRNRFSIWCWNF